MKTKLIKIYLPKGHKRNGLDSDIFPHPCLSEFDNAIIPEYLKREIKLKPKRK